MDKTLYKGTELMIVDAIIIARGGGSLEELWPFNEEIVANAIFGSRIPVISGVGHETDITIADLVADLRAPTPSAAAELAVPDQLVLKEHLSDIIMGSYNVFIRQTESHQRSVSDITQRLISSMPDLNLLRRQIDDFCKVIGTTLIGTTNYTQVELLGLKQRLQTLNPTATLQRGYAIVQRSETGHVLSTTKEVEIGDQLNVTLANGTLRVTNSGLKTQKSNKPSVRSRKHPEMEPLI